MAKKFYGVRKGKRPDVYNSWADCFFQVTGVKEAIYKGFNNEEDAFRFAFQREMKKHESINYNEKKE